MSVSINCNLANNLTRGTACGYSLPQIVELYLANFADVTTTIGAPTGATGGIEVLTIAMAQDAVWYKVEPAVNSASWSDNLAVGGNGNKYKIHTVGFGYSSAYNAGMVDNVDALALGKYVAVARMVDGSYIMLGRGAGLEAQADGVNNSGSGDASAQSGLVVSLTGNSVESALPLSATAIETVVGQ